MNSLSNLKQILQSLTLHTAESDLKTFFEHLQQLEKQHKQAPMLTSFLKMLRSVASYLNAKKETAHADTVAILTSIADGFETALNTPAQATDDISRILGTKIQEYNSFKDKIASKPLVADADIHHLKAVILSIDWEISDITLKNFEKSVTGLMAKLRQYKIHHAFLKIIHSTGRYIGTQKANAHKDSFTFLRSVFENFEHIAQNADLSYKDKKNILESDIKRFQEFKRKIAQKKATPTPVSPEEEDFRPALSHVKKATGAGAEAVSPLTLLPDEAVSDTFSGPAAVEDLEPALSTKNRSSAGSRDIMDDLFRIKASAADELLDEIHLQGFSEGHQSQALNLLDRTEGSRSDTIRNLTPQRMNTDPIPEIESRLDEFFNLEIPAEPPVHSADIPEPPAQALTEPDTDGSEGIVPFQYEDEPYEESTGDEDSPGAETDAAVLLDRLKSGIETPGWYKNESDHQLIGQDISSLRAQYRDDSEKTCLLDLLDSSIALLKQTSEASFQPNTPEILEDTDRLENKPGGLWARIKSVFTAG